MEKKNPLPASSEEGNSRRVPLAGAVNFRDLGGYETTDGRRVRWNRVYRSDHLAKLTRADHAMIKELGIRLVCDFRTEDEVQILPNRLPRGNGLQYLHLPVNNTGMTPVQAFNRVRKGDTDWLTREFLVNGYINSLDGYSHVWGLVLRKLGEAENRPLVFHCTGGKDRTGMFAAILLLALNVPEETVLHDYCLSEQYNAPRISEINRQLRWLGVDPEKVQPYLASPPYLMEAFLDNLRMRYGSIEEYLHQKAALSGKDLSLLRETLLES